MKTGVRNPGAEAGLTLIEALAYIAVLAVIIAVTGKTFATAWDQSARIQRNTDDIKRVLRAGERWRQDIRAATGRIEPQTEAGAQGLVIPTAKGQIVWLVSTNGVRRSASAEAPEILLLPRIKDSQFVEDARTGVTAWRWDVELKPEKKEPRVRPWFTFLAVPTQEKQP
jgi:type II secretory pathway pseudopilin PulG